MLHGGGGSGNQAKADYGWDGAADQGGFVVAYPDGLSRAWNAGACCGPPQESGVDDVGFLDQLVDKLVVEDSVDPAQVYAAGISNGGMMTYAWACLRPGRLRGIGVVAGSLVSPCAAPAPVNLAVVHGTADENIPLEGGVGSGTIGIDHPPLAETVALFRSADSCRPRPTVDTDPPVTATRWRCPAGRHVVQAISEGDGHGWPGGTRDNTGGPSPSVDATAFLVANLRPGGIAQPS